MKTTIGKIESIITSLEAKLNSVSFVLKDTSKKNGKSFKTIAPDLSGVIVVETTPRTKYLYDYLVVPNSEENSLLLEELKAAKEALQEKRVKEANSSLSKKAAKLVKAGIYSKENPEGQFFSAGVYRVVFNDKGEVLASIFGGYFDSRPSHLTDVNKWTKAVEKTLMSYPGAFIILKADGSCGNLFLREDYPFPASKDAVKSYNVPVWGGGSHTNFQLV